MENSLYRVFFFISTETEGRDVSKVKSLLFELPDPYCSTDLQIKVLQKKAFSHWHENFLRLKADQVYYTGNELVPNEKRTENMKPDIIIPSGEWI